MSGHHGHSHSHAGSHSHGAHSHAVEGHDRAFAIGVVLNLAIVVLQIVAGIFAGSLALVADAVHNAADVLGLILSWTASRLGRWRPSRRRTYGLRRSSILASVVNAALLMLGVGAIGLESLQRLFSPTPVNATTVMWVAAAGLVVNGVTASLFLRGRHGDLNIKAAFLHLAGDALVSLGVLVAGFAIRETGLYWIDPAVGLVVAILIVVGTWGVLRESLNLALDGVPADIDPEAVKSYLQELPGVSEVHDLHIWAMSTTETALTVHLVRPAGEIDDALLVHAGEDLKARFAIAHATFQVERGDRFCALASEEAL